MTPLSVTFIGTATVLLRYGELTLLTDPNFLHRGQYAWLGHGLVSRRLTEPAMTPGELPELDGIVLSHLHGDHFDRVARRGLDPAVAVLTTVHAKRHLDRLGFTDVHELRTWQRRTLQRGSTRVHLTAVPARHASGHWQRLLPPVMGSVAEFGESGGRTDLTVYISGDTLAIAELGDIPRRFPNIDLAVLHLGGTTLPGGLVVTMDGLQGADLLQVIDPRWAIPIHYDDYGVFKSPLTDFSAEVQRRGLTDRVRYLQRGDTATFDSGPC